MSMKRRRTDPWVETRTGGAHPKYITIRNEEIKKNSDNFQPVALSKWGEWHDSNAMRLQDRMAERLAGGMVANSSRSVYDGLFKKWKIHRGVLGKTEFLSGDPLDKEGNENAAIAYVALNLGPMERDLGAIQNHLQAIGYFRKLRTGTNPMRTMNRLQNIMKGARRERD